MILKSTKKSMGIVFSILLALVLVPVSGWSQEYGTQEQTSQVDISEEEIVSYAKAQNQLENIRQKYQPKYSNAKGQAEQQKILEEMNKEMVVAIQKEGLNVERYNEILSAAQTDSALQQRISEAIQSMQ